MALFGKNPNEVNYQGGKKHWTDVIKNTGSPDLLIWRQPEEDFNTNSTLIVMPGEQAIFVNGGNVEEVFDNGTYKLSTNNYPFISRLRNAFSGGISTFNCVVYFVKQAHSIEIKWGTSSPMAVRDKLLGIQTKVYARGSYKVSIANPVVFLSKLVGNNVAGVTETSLKSFFGEQFQSKIKATLTKHLNELQTELLGIEARIDEFSEELHPVMKEIMSDYGVNCEVFTISALDLDDTELRHKYDEIGMDAIAKMREIQLQKAAFDVLGDDWARQQSADILSKLAENPGAGGVASAGAGLGMGFAAGGAFGSMAQNMFAPMSQPQVNQAMPQQAPSGRFSQQAPVQPQANPYQQTPAAAPAPAPAAPAADDPMAKLQQLKQFFDMGLINEQEYNSKKMEILSKF